MTKEQLAPHDTAPIDPVAAAIEAGPPSYRLPQWRKNVILYTVSAMTLVVTYSSTAMLPAMPEIAAEFDITDELIAVTNCCVLLAMGMSSLIWLPISSLLGRQWTYRLAIVVLCICSICSACAVNLGMFVAFRILGGFTGTYFMVAGQAMLADIFPPIVRGTAVGVFLAGSVSGPAIAPCIGGIVVTYTIWRVIFWIQAGMCVFGLITSVLVIPDIEKLNGVGPSSEKTVEAHTLRSVLSTFNPSRVLRLMLHPNIFLADLSCGLLGFFQYGLLTSARTIFNPRFHLTTALVSGLFYLAPGTGFLVGSMVGGRLSDRTVRKWIKIRNGVRIPHDRLRSGLVTTVVVLPISMMIFAWTLQTEVGGMPVPIISAFFAGVGLLGTFNGLNTYTAEVIPSRKTEVISGKYIMQYIFGAGATGAVVPMINTIGVGLTFTICGHDNGFDCGGIDICYLEARSRDGGMGKKKIWGLLNNASIGS
ncbi:hypothetical protein FE257_001318 [Aspergillus nanangensis]|uniref:Major facilitator superfamily (MFS) profile domain-containing protein n=1 Tax=Aspergillus nanangensis TaxID=2582783 RepID=A0AAD4CDW4_ASPNN|nr:hypothetical protein FE257_001318 [Aspergillus nanangensis]